MWMSKILLFWHCSFHWGLGELIYGYNKFNTYSETIAHSSNFFTSQRGPHLIQNRIYYWINHRRKMTSEPGFKVKPSRPVQRDWIAMKQIGHDHEIPVCSKLVSNQLRIDEAMSNDICENQNCTFCRMIRRI